MANTNITKKAIKRAFVELLNEKPLDRITVQDIADRCGVNRNTFYYHYQDVPGLLEELCADEFDRVVENYPELNSLDECLNAIMQFALNNRRAVMHIYNSDKRGTYVNSLWRTCEHVVTKYLETVFPGQPLSAGDQELVIRYFKCSCFGMVVDWIGSGMRDEYIADMHRMCRQSRGVAELIINNCRE